MYHTTQNDKSSLSHQPKRKNNKPLKAKALVDNRPSIQQLKKQLNTAENIPVQMQKKGVVLENKKIQNAVVQRALDKRIEDRLVNAVKSNNKADFKRIFRAAAPGMDEMISCDVTFSQCRSQMANEPAMREFLRTSHDTRHSTHGMGHIVKDKSGKEMDFAHPTAVGKAFFARKITKKGNPRWMGHTGFDRARARHVLKGKNPTDFRDRAIEFSYRSGAQPPFARNSVKKIPIAEMKEARRKHNERERSKRRHSLYNKLNKQKHDAQWVPDRSKRGVSPDRGDL